MFWNKKPDPNPRGVNLGELMLMLSPTSIKATQKGNALFAQHEHYSVRVEVVPPDDAASENGPIRAVVRVVTQLPSQIQALVKGREASTSAMFNSFAALGAMYSENYAPRIGSRLTIYEQEDSWSTLHLPLLLFTVIGGTEAILGGFRKAMTSEAPRDAEESSWTSRDLEQVQGYLSRVGVCTTGGLGLTAEFGLASDAVSAARGDRKTALFQLMADEPHPELGAGLFCILQMPHHIESEERLQTICLQLNQMEMAAHDLPPHFGAWCPGRVGNNPAYVSFLPNALYSASGIAVNVGIWAMHRAQWANAMLASLGERA